MISRSHGTIIDFLSGVSTSIEFVFSGISGKFVNSQPIHRLQSQRKESINIDVNDSNDSEKIPSDVVEYVKDFVNSSLNFGSNEDNQQLYQYYKHLQRRRQISKYIGQTSLVLFGIGVALSYEMCANFFKLDDNDYYGIYTFVFQVLSDFTINKPLMWISGICGWISMLFMDKYDKKYKEKCLQLMNDHCNTANELYGKDNLGFKLVNTECCCNCHRDSDSYSKGSNTIEKNNKSEPNGKQFAVIIFKKNDNVDEKVKLMNKKIDEMSRTIKKKKKRLNSIEKSDVS